MLLDSIISHDDQVLVAAACTDTKIRACMAHSELDSMVERIMLPYADLYMVCTSDGNIHEFHSYEDFVQCLDHHDAEVVDAQIFRGQPS